MQKFHVIRSDDDLILELFPNLGPDQNRVVTRSLSRSEAFELMMMIQRGLFESDDWRFDRLETKVFSPK